MARRATKLCNHVTLQYGRLGNACLFCAPNGMSETGDQLQGRLEDSV